MNITKVQDSDGHWYWIPNNQVEAFKKEDIRLSNFTYDEKPDSYDLFSEKYEQYRTLGDPYQVPTIFEEEAQREEDLRENYDKT